MNTPAAPAPGPTIEEQIDAVAHALWPDAVTARDRAAPTAADDRERLALYAALATLPSEAAQEGVRETLEALKPFTLTGWMSSDTEHTARTVVAHMHPEREREIILSSEDFRRAAKVYAALSAQSPLQAQPVTRGDDSDQENASE